MFTFALSSEKGLEKKVQSYGTLCINALSEDLPGAPVRRVPRSVFLQLRVFGLTTVEMSLRLIYDPDVSELLSEIVNTAVNIIRSHKRQLKHCLCSKF